jgi:adenine-specific DNA-methyltransferase
MALVDALIDKITDRSLRAALRKEVDLLLGKQQFGLVFQQHKPETVELYNHRVHKNCKVRVRSEEGDALYRVDKVRGDRATITSLTDEPESREIERDELVVVREFGDPIYPGLKSTGKVERGGEKPAHLVINAENFHALELLLYTHLGKVDAIYIDPPYNTRDKDWKYNNDYVDSDDIYVHSKWLAMMERRLKLAEQLLNPENSVLIVTIDEKEYLRLGLLLEQTFRNARIQMVSTVINPKGASRPSAFYRTDEYIYFVMFGNASPLPAELSNEWKVVRDLRSERLRWAELLRAGTNARRVDRQQLFYPIFLRNTDDGPVFHSVGEFYLGEDLAEVIAPEGTVAVWPIRSDGSEGNWQLSPAALRGLIAKGYARIGNWREHRTSISYLKRGEQKKVEDGLFPIIDRRVDGAIVVDGSDYTPIFVPGTQWRIPSHEAGGPGGSNLLRAVIPGRRFPFPKSLYAVEDALRFFVSDKPNATVLDFFAGSGTTMHAVARLNRQDAGRRRSICVTNNEVSDAETVRLQDAGFRPGDPQWEALGICEHVTKPRVEAVITGRTPEGNPIVGDYKFVDPGPMAEGFEENAEFFTLTYEDRDQIERGRRFEALAPVLWLTAGGIGERVEKPVEDWSLPDKAVYGVLFNDDKWRDFVDAVIGRKDTVTHIFVATESTSTFQQILTELPSGIRATQLYSNYLDTFEINTKGRS